VPFICSSTMKTIGTILSEIVVVTPFSHPKLDNVGGVGRYWTSLVNKVFLTSNYSDHWTSGAWNE
jgi:hypothetical protein